LASLRIPSVAAVPTPNILPRPFPIRTYPAAWLAAVTIARMPFKPRDELQRNILDCRRVYCHQRYNGAARLPEPRVFLDDACWPRQGRREKPRF